MRQKEDVKSHCLLDFVFFLIVINAAQK